MLPRHGHGERERESSWRKDDVSSVGGRTCLVGIGASDNTRCEGVPPEIRVDNRIRLMETEEVGRYLTSSAHRPKPINFGRSARRGCTVRRRRPSRPFGMRFPFPSYRLGLKSLWLNKTGSWTRIRPARMAHFRRAKTSSTAWSASDRLAGSMHFGLPDPYRAASLVRVSPSRQPGRPGQRSTLSQLSVSGVQLQPLLLHHLRILPTRLSINLLFFRIRAFCSFNIFYCIITVEWFIYRSTHF